MLFIEGLLTTLVIDAYKGIEIDTFNDTGEYLHTDMPNKKKFY